MKKNFYTRISDLPGSRNDRLITLLTDLGLEDRLYYDRDAHKLDFDKPIDYSAVHQKLQCLIDSSKDYLKNI